MKKTSYFVYIFTLFLAFICLPLTAQSSYTRHIDLTTQESNWNAVMNGALVCPPEATSYGFVVLNEGRSVVAFNENGTIRWQRKISGRPNPYLAVLPGDFVLTVSGRNTMTLINPEGRVLWQLRAPFNLADAPFAGRDARIFARGKNNIACWSIKGVCKWNIKTDEQKDFPLQEFPDGSIVVMLAQTESGCSTALRVTPFGGVMERIVFPATVSSWTQTSDGLLVTFAEGGASLFTLDANKKIAAVWTIPASDTIFAGDKKNDAFFISYSTTRAALVQPSGSNALVRFLKTSDGTVTTEYTVPDINVHHISYVKSFLRGMIFADTDTAVYCTERSARVWSAELPAKTGKNGWNYLIYTTGGYLTICRTSWLIESFRVVQNVGGDTLKLQERGDYAAFLKSVTLLYELYVLEGKIGKGLTDSERREALAKGMYGEKEMEWLTELNDTCRTYIDSRKSSNSGARVARSLFAEDVKGTDNMMKQLSCYGTSTFQPVIAELLKIEKSGDHLLTLIKVCGELAYDPDGVLIDALDDIASIIPERNAAALTALCDSVYEICSFMGQHEQYIRGRTILTKLLQPAYSSKTRAYVLATIGKIRELAKALDSE